MAGNRRRHEGRKLHLNVSGINGSGAGNLCKSGDPGVLGGIAFVCLTDEDANGEATVDTKGVYLLSVVAGAAMVTGQVVNWDNAGGNLINGAGDRFGTLVTPIAGAGTEEVEVRVGY